MDNLIEGEDFYYNEVGYMVLTKKYHLQKGSCCGNGCQRDELLRTAAENKL